VSWKGFRRRQQRRSSRDGKTDGVPRKAWTARLAAEARFRGLVAERLALTPKKEVYIFIHGARSDFVEPMYVMPGSGHFLDATVCPWFYTVALRRREQSSAGLQLRP